MAERKTLEGYLNAKFGFHPRSGQPLVLDCLQALALIHPNERVRIAEVACTAISSIGNLSPEDEEFSIRIFRRGETLYYPSITKPGEINEAHFYSPRNCGANVLNLYQYTKANSVRFSPHPEQDEVNLDALRKYMNDDRQFIFDCTREYYEADGFFLDKVSSKHTYEAIVGCGEWNESETAYNPYWAFAKGHDRLLVIPSYSPCLQVSAINKNRKIEGIME